MSTYNFKTSRAFTLIELLVVIAIIGILSSVVLASLNSAREKARDARRLADLRQLKTAIEFFYDENNSVPSDTCATDGSYSSDGGTCGGVTGDWHANSGMRELVTGGFMPALPTDPINNFTYQYFYEPAEKGACLWANNFEGTTETIGAIAGEPVDVTVSPYNTGNYALPPVGYQCVLDTVL